MPNPLDFLNPINVAVEAGKNVVDVITGLKDRHDRETTSFTADLTDLIGELSKTHATIVKMISPLRRIKDDPATFGDDFRAVYNDFRDFYDAYDFSNERTHCHKIRQIQHRMLKRKPRFGSTQQWDDLYQSLSYLGNSDSDIIEDQYRPFMAWFDRVMKKIAEEVDRGDISQAITEKRAFLADLDPEYERNKAMLETMTNLVGKLTAGL
jgi:hypothetical protein